MTHEQRVKIAALVRKGWYWCGADEHLHDCQLMSYSLRTHRTYVLVDRNGRVWRG